jgi:hypothetical protein
MALIQNRPVLGGNASSEVRVWINGATGGAHNEHAREDGVVEGLRCANRNTQPRGDADAESTAGTRSSARRATANGSAATASIRSKPRD